jgi:alpha-1,2-mannosyltransferase
VGGRALNYFDLQIYRGAAARVVHQVSLYRSPILGRLGFTYPPFAALVFTPLAVLPLRTAEPVVTAGNLLLLGWAFNSALCLASEWGHEPRTTRDRAKRRTVVAFAVAAAIWLEPVSVALGYGQVDVLIAALIVFDLSRPDSSNSKGVAIGLAAAIKLTPLLFIVYLLVSGRRRAAAIATTVFVATIGVSFVVLSSDASAYWGRLIFEITRIGNGTDPANQSLRGALARLDPVFASSFLGPALVVAVAIASLWLAVRAGRRGDEAAAFSLVALSALLASPISWTHHWTLVAPALLLLGRRAYEHRSRRLTLCTIVLALVGYSYAPELVEGGDAPHGVWSLVSDPYVLSALVVLIGVTP